MNALGSIDWNRRDGAANIRGFNNQPAWGRRGIAERTKFETKASVLDGLGYRCAAIGMRAVVTRDGKRSVS